MTNNQTASIFITGASSGIGRALAIEYAEKGTYLFLCGRNEKRLHITAETCEKKGAIVHLFLFDVLDETVTRTAIEEANKIKPLDLVIANAGVSGGVLCLAENEKETRQVFSTNISGVINTVLPAIQLMSKAKHGQIAIMSSIAGFRGLMNCPAYSASKNCVKAWGEALRGSLKKNNIKVNVICPGFIKTPLTDANTFAMPFILEPEKAAKIIKKGLKKNKGIIAFPFIMGFFARLMLFIPRPIIEYILQKMPQKEK